MSRRDWSLTILIVSFGGIWPTRFVRLFLATYAVRQLRCRQSITIYFSLGRKDGIFIRNNLIHLDRPESIGQTKRSVVASIPDDAMQLQISGSIQYYKTDWIRKISRMYSLQYSPTRILKLFRTILARRKGTIEREYTWTLNFHQFNAAFTVCTEQYFSRIKMVQRDTSDWVPLAACRCDEEPALPVSTLRPTSVFNTTWSWKKDATSWAQ